MLWYNDVNEGHPKQHVWLNAVRKVRPNNGLTVVRIDILVKYNAQVCKALLNLPNVLVTELIKLHFYSSPSSSYYKVSSQLSAMSPTKYCRWFTLRTKRQSFKQSKQLHFFYSGLPVNVLSVILTVWQPKLKLRSTQLFMHYVQSVGDE